MDDTQRQIIDLTKSMVKMQEQIRDLQQRRVSQLSIIPASVKQRHMIASTDMVNGDMFYGDGTNNILRLPAGEDGEVLTIVDGVPTWV